MNFSSLTAISPIDGRYQSKTVALQPYFSEFGLIKYRVQIEVEYLIALAEWKLKPLANFPLDKTGELRNIYMSFSESDALWIKEKEKITNHDVKAVEYFLKDKLIGLGLTQFLEFVPLVTKNSGLQDEQRIFYATRLCERERSPIKLVL